MLGSSREGLSIKRVARWFRSVFPPLADILCMVRIWRCCALSSFSHLELGRICTESLTPRIVVILTLTMDENFSVRLTTCMEMI